MNTEKISIFISKKRKEKNLTQKELADLTHLSEKTISKWECGRGIPDIGNLQSLSKALDISVTELLNGEEENQEQPVIDYIQYKEKKNNKKIIITSTIFILIIAIIVLLFSLLNNFNTVKIYELSGESEHFNYGPALVMKSNIKNMLVEGNITPKDQSITTEHIKYVAYYCENTLIVGHGYKLVTGDYYLEDNGYNEIFDNKKLKNINKWKIVIDYQTENGIKQETIQLQAKEVMKNNKLFYKKKEAISNEDDQKDYLETIKEESEELKQFLLNHGFKNKNDEKYVKKVKDGEFEIISMINKKISKFQYTDNDYYVIFQPFTQTYMFVNKNDNNHGLHYTRKINKYTCSQKIDNADTITECPKGTDKIITKYIDIIDKEFKDIIPSKEQWTSTISDKDV